MGKIRVKQYLGIVLFFLSILIYGNGGYLFCCEPASKCRILIPTYGMSLSGDKIRSFTPDYEKPNPNEDWEVVGTHNQRYNYYENFYFKGVLDTKKKFFLITDIKHLVPIPEQIEIYTGESYKVYIKSSVSYVNRGMSYTYKFSPQKFFYVRNSSGKIEKRVVKRYYKKQCFYKV